MLHKLLIVSLLSTSLYSLEKTEKLYNCTKIFEERKDELLVELERIDEQRQALDALKVATKDLLAKKEKRLNEQEAKIDSKLEEAKSKEESISKMLEENKKVLEELTSTKMSKVSRMYAKMKPSSAAAILSDMDTNESAKIFQTLKPKTVGNIFAKMDAKKASEITLILTNIEDKKEK
ncbi:MAG: PDP protein [Campylobacterota bacterium]|nr:PDP protein [Campylobacterota bacterium]